MLARRLLTCSPTRNCRRAVARRRAARHGRQVDDVRVRQHERPRGPSAARISAAAPAVSVTRASAAGHQHVELRVVQRRVGVVRVAQVVDGVDERLARARAGPPTSSRELLGRAGVEPELQVEDVELVRARAPTPGRASPAATTSGWPTGPGRSGSGSGSRTGPGPVLGGEVADVHVALAAPRRRGSGRSAGRLPRAERVAVRHSPDGLYPRPFRRHTHPYGCPSPLDD